MPTLRITHVDSERAWRGGQQSLFTLAIALRQRGHEQTVVAPADSPLAARARSEGFRVIEKAPRSGDLVHSHSGHAHNAALWATLGSSIKRVVTRHVAFTPRNRLVHRLKYTWTCDGIIAVSRAVREQILAAGVPDSKIEVIHTGIELPPEPAPRLPLGPLTVGHLGAFSEEKGQDLLIEAARRLPGTQFILAGEGPLSDDFKRRAPGNVTLRGFIEDPAAFFAELDLFVMPSRSEAWGLAALEAMAHGVPVLASDTGGLPEIAGSNRVFPAGDVAALVAKIKGFDRNQWQAESRAARERAAQFSIKRMAERTEEFYLRVLAPHRP